MTPLDRAIHICGTQSDLVRRVVGKPATGYVYHWRKNGFTELVAVDIERAVADAIAESADAAERAVKTGGPVMVEEIFPDREWQRDESGRVVGYTTRIPSLSHEPQVAG